jgi:metal-sulfur cluster biosynthetic enzyme
MPIKPRDHCGADHAGMDPQDISDTGFDDTRQRALQALTQVADPEVCENIVDLGLVERLDITPQRIALTLVLTSATCPMGDAILDDAYAALQRAFPAHEVAVEETQDVAWTPQRMSEAARQRLGWNDAQG